MAMSLHIYAEDPNVEEVLTLLESKNLSLSQKVIILERSLSWVKRADKFLYDAASQVSIKFEIVGTPAPNPCNEQTDLVYNPR